MNTSIIIATYGDEGWRELAWTRAHPSAEIQDANEIIVLHEPDLTIAQVRNKAAKQATSEWLCFLDADDELAPGFLAATEEARQKVVQSGVIERALYTPKVSYVFGYKKRAPVYLTPRGTLKDDNHLVVGTVVERELFNKVGGFGDYPHGYEDWSLWAKCWKAGAQVVRTDAVYIAYVNRNSKHRIAWKNRRQQVEMHHKVRAELFPEEYVR